MVVVITLLFNFEEVQSGSAIYYTKKKKEGRGGREGEREEEREGEEEGEEERKKRRRHLK